MGTRWIIEGRIDQRWPVNTRGNVGEVFPEVITALGYHLGVVPAEKAWRSAYAELGIMSPDDFAGDDPVIIGLYGGYCYLNLSYLRMMGVRAPGSSAEAIDVAFFGEGNPPPYVARKGDKSLRSSVRILRTVLGALGTKQLPDIVADSFRRSAAFEALRPDLDAPDADLLDYLYAFPEAFEPLFGNHMQTTAVAAIVSGILADASAAAGNPGLVTHLVGASGDVQSALYATDLYEIAKVIRQQPSVMSAFDEGLDGLLERTASNPDAAGFRAMLDGFLATHGHRGPNDWELSARTWDNTPDLVLTALDRMRVAGHDLSPSERLSDDGERRSAAADLVRPHLRFMDRSNFNKALRALPFWSQAREATRDRAVRVMLPVKQVYRELVRRSVDRGGTAGPTEVALLDPFTELPDYIRDPTSLAALVDERSSLRNRFAAVEPPFFISSQDDVPTIEELEATAATATRVEAANPGDVLTGDAGASGLARGRARIIHDPADAGSLEPGDVLVAPITDPAWTPLFLPAAAVVVNVGALMSHAVIVARELAIPCVIALEGATDLIPDGAMIEVDGTAGTVTLIET
ncbi:MAG: PEP-utilizing enzyme [Acidimicrobiales bacterium]|jgi:pyruvate,water dikinase|nr:PEP-utilizing enzyme [Acidimicrobiales bacterium]|tara:strand:+ start:262 stop:1992 length:1731 start_codon:yes stop_codon:yes gene_type:complete